MANSDFSTVVGSALGIDPSEVFSKLDGLTIEQMNDLTNAAIDNNIDKVREIADQAARSGEINPLLNDPDSATTETPASSNNNSPQNPPQPSQAPSTSEQTDDADNADEEQTNESEESPSSVEPSFSVGEKVMVGDKEGVVKNPRGPNGMVHCVVDGVSRMVNPQSLKRVDECVGAEVLGMADMADLDRMLSLAGMKPASFAQAPFQVAKIRTNPVPAAPVSQGEHIAVATDFGNDSPIEDIVDAFDEIDENLPNIKQGEVKLVRQMVNDVNNSLNEKRFGFLRSLLEEGKGRVEDDKVVEAVHSLGYSRPDANKMVSNYFDVLGVNGNDAEANQVVKRTISALKKKRH